MTTGLYWQQLDGAAHHWRLWFGDCTDQPHQVMSVSAGTSDPDDGELVCTGCPGPDGEPGPHRFHPERTGRGR